MSAGARPAWGITTLALVLSIPTVVLLIFGAGVDSPGDGFGLGGFGGVAFLFAALVFVATGAAIASRAPNNAIGWLFCLTGACVGSGTLAYQYADHALYVAEPALPGGVAAAWLQNVLIAPAFGMLGIALLIFPDGRLPSRRWWPALGLSLTGVLALAVGYGFRPGPLDVPFETVVNPVGIEGAFEPLDSLAGGGWLLAAAGVAVAAVAMTVRLRRSHGTERQQLKWIALAAVGVGAALVANALSFVFEVQGVDELRIVLVGAALAGLPTAAAIAILRYRLYDIDVVINRALVYGALTATLVVAYVGGVLLLQFGLSPLTERNDLAVAGSTLAVAALFRPARTRIQALVDRRFYRRRYDAARTLQAFTGRLREQVDIEALRGDLYGVVRDTVQPTHVSLWLRGVSS